ncbi:class I adenylate-forming enzyme family protein [Burkholderia sp. PU8-34]
MVLTVAEFISESAKKYGEKTALIFEDQSYSFERLDALSTVLASRLERFGLCKGDRVSIYAPNCAEWVISYYAIAKVGGVVNPLNLMLTPAEAAFAVEDCGARFVIGTGDRIAGLYAALPEDSKVELAIAFGEDIPFWAQDFDSILLEDVDRNYRPAYVDASDSWAICYTSGTTGHPKGAVLTHESVVANTGMTATMHMRSALDTVVSALPCSHVYGNIVLNSAVACGMTLVLHKTFDATAILESIQRYRATLFEGVPTMYMYLLNYPDLDKFDVSSLTRCTVGGQTMPAVKLQEVERRFGCPLIELWGMTEIGGLGATHTVYGPRRIGSIGIPLPHVLVRIASQTDPEIMLSSGEVGELQIRGPIVMKEYLGKPEATTQTILEGGWLRTGDVAYIDDDGFIFVVDRLKDMIITAGFNIYPAELERVIAAYEGVAMVAVGSVPDVEKGELAKAYIVPKQGVALDLSDIEKHCRENLAAYKVPRAFQIVDDLPKTSTGKVMRRMLRAAFEAS